jgi:hypothetical protein
MRKILALKCPEDQIRAAASPEMILFKCPSHFGGKPITWGEKNNNAPLRIEIDPSGILDFTHSWTSDVLIGERIPPLLEKHKIKGFTLRPVAIEFPKSITTPPPRMFHLVPTGWGGFPAREAGFRLRRVCPQCGRKDVAYDDLRRLADPSAGDGSDIFTVWPMIKVIFVSERFAQFCRDENVSGVNLVPPEEAFPDPFKGRGFTTSGDLEVVPSTNYIFPPNRARELEQLYRVSDWPF